MRKKVLACFSVSLLVNACETTSSKRGVANESAVAPQTVRCDLNTDKCNGQALSQVQIAKSLFLTDIVAEKLLEIEKAEKAKGREFKVALIGRKGSDLSKFQPLKDLDGNGQVLSSEELIKNILEASNQYRLSQGNGGAPGNTIEPNVMRFGYFDRSRSLKFSHLGIALKNMVLKDKQGRLVVAPEKGQWAVVHLLYSCEDQKQSYVFKGSLGHFFHDHMSDYGAQILVPEATMQNRIEEIVVKDYLGNNWIEKQYNAIALADDLNQQNSNQWVLEVLAASMFPAGQIKDRAQAQEALKKTNYHETKVTPVGLYSAIKTPLVSKILSSLMPTVCMQYQPNIQKYGIGEIISALSLEEYLVSNKRLAGKYEVELTPEDTKFLDTQLGSEQRKTFNDNQRP